MLLKGADSLFQKYHKSLFHIKLKRIYKSTSQNDIKRLIDELDEKRCGQKNVNLIFNRLQLADMWVGARERFTRGAAIGLPPVRM